MTANDFETAARAEANKLTEHWGGERNRRRFLSIFTSGAEWARTHLAAQEPTDAEVEAAAVVIWESYDLLDRAAIRDALSAARAARRDEEKRDA